MAKGQTCVSIRKETDEKLEVLQKEKPEFKYITKSRLVDVLLSREFDRIKKDGPTGILTLDRIRIFKVYTPRFRHSVIVSQTSGQVVAKH